MSSSVLHIAKSKVALRMLVLFVFSLIPLAALLLIALSRVTEELEEQAHDRLRHEASILGVALVERLQFTEGVLESLAELLESEGSDARMTMPLFEQFSALTWQSEDQRVVFSGVPSELPNLTQEDHEHLAGGATLVLCVRGTLPATVLLVRQATLGDRDGLIVGEIDPDHLWRPLHLFAETGDVSVVQQGELVFLARGASEPGSRPARRGLRPEVGEEWVSAEWTAFLVPAYRLRWKIVRTEPVEVVLASVSYFRTIFMLGSMLTFCSVILVSMIQIRRQLIPVSVLHEATRKIADDDLSHRVLIDSGDEFEDLADSFNTMAERVRARTLELERASRAKDEFLANMSHEIRTPMTAILGLVDECQDEGTSDEERVVKLGVVATSGQHLLRVISDILDISKIESGLVQVEKSVCRPERILTDVLALFTAVAEDKGVDLSGSCRGSVPEQAFTDPTRLRQILTNVISNAVKFTTDGYVRVALELCEDESGRELVFTVEDSGIGMTPEQARRVFDPFVQADSSTTRRFGGTGLGLSIARSLAVQLGGDVRWENRLEGGSRFRISIDPGHVEDVPAVPADHEEPAIPRRGPGLRLEGRVLLAEDVPVNRRIVARMLERLGLVVDEAENGRTALDAALARLADDQPYDVILLDIQMPEMDGHEVLRNLRTAGHDGPVVALTSHSMSTERARCFEEGFDEFATKPVDRAALAEILARSLAAARDSEDAESAA